MITRTVIIVERRMSEGRVRIECSKSSHFSCERRFEQILNFISMQTYEYIIEGQTETLIYLTLNLSKVSRKTLVEENKIHL